MARAKNYHESYARFFEEPSREALRDLLRANPGELRSLDFKSQWPEAPSLAKHVLGLANSGGGCLVAGVSESADGSLISSGLPAMRDKAVIFDALLKYLPQALVDQVEVVDFPFDESEYPVLVGKKFQVLFVQDDPSHLPFVAVSDGKGIRKGAVYVRHEGMTIEAGYDSLQTVINRRISTGHSTQREIDLKTHLEQLKVLYSFLNRHELFGYGGALTALMAAAGPNPKYPREDFEAFVVRMIKIKKMRIATELDLPDMSG